MAITKMDVLASVCARFGEDGVERIVELLDRYGVEPHERERERVQLAIVALSGGDEAKLRDFVAAAKRDYRDVLMWAESPQEATLDTPEKRRRFREMLAKFGIEVPDALKD